MAKRIKHNDLTHYFLRDHAELPRAYLASCEKCFDSIGRPGYYGGTNTKGKIYKLKKPQAPSSKPDKRQASSNKPQAPSNKLDNK